jgi:hypothetical protein
MKRPNRTASTGGAITFRVFDARGSGDTTLGLGDIKLNSGFGGHHT